MTPRNTLIGHSVAVMVAASVGAAQQQQTDRQYRQQDQRQQQIDRQQQQQFERQQQPFDRRTQLDRQQRQQVHRQTGDMYDSQYGRAPHHDVWYDVEEWQEPFHEGMARHRGITTAGWGYDYYDTGYHDTDYVTAYHQSPYSYNHYTDDWHQQNNEFNAWYDDWSW